MRILYYLLTGLVLIAMASAQDSTPSNASAAQSSSVSSTQSGAQPTPSATAPNQVPGSGSQVQVGNIIYAELAKSIDAKKAKVGDEVIAKTEQAVLSNGKVVAPRGAKILGHLTSVKQHTKDQPQSELGMAFDHMVLKNGNQVPVSLSLQAIGSGQTAAAASATGDQDYGMAPMGQSTGGAMPGGRSGMGGTMGTARGTTGGVANTGGSVAGMGTPTANPAGHISASSRGVVGLPDLSLSAAPSGAAQGSIISSSKKNVKLDSGTELVLRVNPQQ